MWLGEGAEIHPEAVVEGPAVIGENCRIEAGVRLGPYTVLGTNVRVRANADLERVGDQAVNIAERVIDMNAYPQVELPVDIPRMAGVVSGMVRRALESFIHAKADVAEAVLKMDNVVDDMNREAFVALANTMHDSREVTRQALDTLLIVRNLERVADHATNIAEDVIFWVRGTDVRHLGPAADEASEPTRQQ